MKTIRRNCRAVVRNNIFDYSEGISHVELMKEYKKPAIKLPEIAWAFIKKRHLGSSFHFAMALFYRLRLSSVDCFIVITPDSDYIDMENTDNYFSVCYQIDDKWFISDLTKYAKGVKGKHYAISIESFIEKNSTIYFYDPYGEKGNKVFFGDFMQHPTAIVEDGKLVEPG